MKHLSPFFVRKRLDSLTLGRPLRRYVDGMLDLMEHDNRMKADAVVAELFPLDSQQQGMAHLVRLLEMINAATLAAGQLLRVRMTAPSPTDSDQVWVWFEGPLAGGDVCVHGRLHEDCSSEELELQDKNKPVVVFYQNEMMLDWVNGAVVVVDKEGRVAEANNTALAALGWSLNEFVGRNLHETIHHSMDDGCNYPWEYCPVFAAIEDGSSHHVDGDIFWRRDGDSFQVDLIVCPARNEKGDVAGAVLIFRNLTEKKLKETSRVHSLKLESIGVLAAGVAHEINTPIQFIAGNLAYLKESFQSLADLLQAYQHFAAKCVLGKPELASALDALQEREQDADLEYHLEEVPNAFTQTMDGVDRVSHLVQGLKGFANSGSSEPQLSDINEIVKNAVIVCQGNYAEVADLELDLVDLPMVRVASSDLSHVVVNLVSNAATAIADLKQEPPSRGRIRVVTRAEERFVVIEISDTGVGIPEHLHTRIFDPFFTTREVGQGMGQGLTISRSIILKHQGLLSFNTSPGNGSTFYVRLPLKG